MRYGMNTHQSALVHPALGHLGVADGEPSFINYLYALNAWQLVHEARGIVGLPVAASFKHSEPMR